MFGLWIWTAISLAVRSLVSAGRFLLRLSRLGLLLVLTEWDELFRSQAMIAAVFTFLLGC